MKTLNKLLAAVMTVFMSIPIFGVAQNEGTYIDNLGVQDSSYMEIDLLSGAGQSSGSGSATTIIVIVLAVIVLAVILFIAKRKKKK